MVFSVQTYKPFGTPVSPSGTEKFEYAGEMIVSAAGTAARAVLHRGEVDGPGARLTLHPPEKSPFSRMLSRSGQWGPIRCDRDQDECAIVRVLK